jgi:hypothetical protein
LFFFVFFFVSGKKLLSCEGNLLLLYGCMLVVVVFFGGQVLGSLLQCLRFEKETEREQKFVSCFWCLSGLRFCKQTIEKKREQEMAMAITGASPHESRWGNVAAWEQQPKTDGLLRDGDGGGAGGWELKDWESITLLYAPTTTTMTAAAAATSCGGGGNANENCSILHEVFSMVKSEPDTGHQQHEAAPAALKLGLRLPEKSVEEEVVFKGCSSSSSSSVAAVAAETTIATSVAVAAVAPPVVAVVPSSSSSPSHPSSKKQRVMSPGSQNPRCQVEGCTADLSASKEYHRKHKVCEMHSKASRAMAGGREQRFCQQCSR